MSVRLSNLNLFVADVAASARFYSTFFGLKWDEDRSQPPDFAFLEASNLSITLQSPATPGAIPGQADSIEVGFEADELSEIRDRLKAARVEVGSIQQMGWGSAFETRDPNGIRLTIFSKSLRDEADDRC